MTKRFIITLLAACLILLPLSLFAEDKMEITTVTQIPDMELGTWINLEGNILEKLRHEIYLFRDSTGEMELFIRDDRWGDFDYDPDKISRVYGKVILKDGKIKIEPKRVKYLD